MATVNDVKLPTTDPVLKYIQGTTYWTSSQLSFSFASIADESTVSATLLDLRTVRGTLDWLSTDPLRDPVTTDNKVDAQKILSVYSALDAYERVLDLDFDIAQDFDSADFKFVGMKNLVAGNKAANGKGNFPGTNPKESAEGNEHESYIFISTTSTDTRPLGDLGAGTGAHRLALHEIGHALGLAHPFDSGNGTPGQTGLLFDNERFTVMSYNRSSTSAAFGHAVTPMALDIAALDALYGLKAAATGNNTYRLNDPGTKGLQLDPAAGDVEIGAAYYCIWDTGGEDTIRYDGNYRVVLNLAEATLSLSDTQAYKDDRKELQNTELWNSLPFGVQLELTSPGQHLGGFFSRILKSDSEYFDGGYSIAKGVEIDNAQGGKGADFIWGNALDNKLTGGLGADYLLGGDGVDIILTGRTATETGDKSGVADVVSLSDVGLVLDGFPNNLPFANYADGQSGNDVIYGSGGSDYLIGNAGVDVISGGSGIDLIFGDGKLTADSKLVSLVFDYTTYTYVSTASPNYEYAFMTAADGPGSTDPDARNWIDTIYTGAGEDVVFAGDGNDTVYGEGGDDILCGNAGNDTLYGGNDDDQLNGGSGRDTLVGGRADDDYFCYGELDTIVELNDAFGGIDTVFFDVANMGAAGSFAANVEYWHYTGLSELIANLPREHGHGTALWVGGAASSVSVNATSNTLVVCGEGTDTIKVSARVDSFSLSAFESGLDKINLSAFNIDDVWVGDFTLSQDQMAEFNSGRYLVLDETGFFTVSDITIVSTAEGLLPIVSNLMGCLSTDGQGGLHESDFIL